ncbi:MAG: serine O-acetyltransferase [Gallintestinimicrobium sp.]|uniref:serine O-acetyltransferase n=1 Tax=Gallintestinimicrobium sp. TaxID=2981655 RepID=UPI00399AD0F6
MNYSLKELVLADLYRYEGKTDTKSFLHAYATYEGFKFSVWLRMCSVARKKKLTKIFILPICRMIYRHYKYKYGYDIPYAIEIGPGLQIFHIGGIVFSPAKCGKNITLSQNTTVGMTIHNGKKQYPVLQDNIYIAPGAIIIGDITVGSDVAIGSNSVLTKSVEDYSVVVGIPGKVISKKGSREYVSNRI